MKRIIIAGTIAFLAAVTVSTALVHDNLLQAFIANDMLSQGIRVAVIGLLVILLITSPPRSIHFRTALGFSSAALSIGVAVMLSQYAMPFLDALLYVEVAIIFALEALESPVLTKKPAKLPVVYKTQNKKIAI